MTFAQNPGTWEHGPWTLYKPDWDLPWRARHRDTGEDIDTGEGHLMKAMDSLDISTDQEARGCSPLGKITFMPKRTTASPRGWEIL